LVEVQADSNDATDPAHIDYWVTPEVIAHSCTIRG
jgi:hypothetical protein